MSASSRIAERWIELAYPDIRVDSYVSKLNDDTYKHLFEDAYNHLPMKCKEFLKGVEIHLCGDPFMVALANQSGVLGFCRPKEKKVCFNVQRFEESDRRPEDFSSLIYHEIAHFMVYHFTDNEKAFYFKLFGTEPKTSGEPEADGFVAYMKGLAPYRVHEFWAWWAVQGIG
jgi:hypothetical protein